MKILNSLRKLSKLEKHSIILPNIGRLNIYLKCTIFNDQLAKLMNSLESEEGEETLVALAPSFLGERYSIPEMITALLEAYTLTRYGFSKARRRGLEVLRVLCNEKNLGKVANTCGAKPGETIVLLIATPHKIDTELSRLEEAECFAKPRPTKIDITRVAVYPVEARLFRIQATSTRTQS